MINLDSFSNFSLKQISPNLLRKNSNSMNKKSKKRSRLSIFVPKANINIIQGFDAEFWLSEGYRLYVEGKLSAAID
jgi:hypothetical protein